MTPNLRPRSRVLAGVIVLAIALAACASTGSPSSANAATVGGAAITNEQLQHDVVLFRFLAGLSGGECGAPIEGESAESACARVALSNDIREELVKAYAAEHELALGPDDVTKAITQLETNLGGPEQLDTQLHAAELTRQDLEALADRLLLFDVVQNDVASKGLDEAALRKVYEEQIDTFTTVEVAHILVQDEAQAQEIADTVTPETFAKVAKRLSEDPGSAAKGGNLGSYSEAGFKAQLVPEFVAGTLALQPGEISQPVKSQFGWHVIYLIRRDVAPFEDVRAQLVADQGGPLFQQWFVDQAAATEIEVNPRYGRLDQATLNVLPVRSTAQEPTGATGATGTVTGP